MKNLLDEPDTYRKTTYAAWLGKIIGVRLGSPDEGWSSQKIEETYHGKKGYLVDYDIYASDDDTNGPLFFVRALEGKKEIKPQDVAEVLLGYLQEYSGFFWWGGVGVSTEHTAYENLKNGIPAPRSGSKEQNGIAIAEQIGGQIFSDCWGYVSGGNPEQAARFARMASSVTHDGNGIQGGIFVASAIAIAYTETDAKRVIQKALKYLDPEMEYARKIRIIMDFYEQHPDNWRECLAFIQENYGYDKYPGVCHIIPNLCVMIMGLCYGENDFSRTLTITNEAGWDTDCNCGNVGSIMGALVGLDGIDPSWIQPINDIVNGSSCIGYLNIQTVSQSADYFTALAYQVQGKSMPEYKPFTLPYATMGFRCEDGKPLIVKDGALWLPKQGTIYQYTYYKGEDLYDSRYDPCFSPIIVSGDTISFVLDDTDGVEVFAQDCDGNREYGQAAEKTITLSIRPGSNKVIHCIGLINHSGKKIGVRDIRITHAPDLRFDFTNYPVDVYGPRYAGDNLTNLRGWVFHSGTWVLDEEGLRISASEHFLASTGVPFYLEYAEMEFNGDGKLVFGMKDARHFDAIGIEDGKLVILRKNGDKENRIELSAIEKKKYFLRIKTSRYKIGYNIDDISGEIEWISPKGIIGVCGRKTAGTKIIQLSVRGKEEW